MMVLAVGVLLLIACANIAGLQVARGAAREHEMAVRLAIGAGRRRVARQLLIESLVLGVIGGGAGLAVARTLARLLVPALNLDTDAALQVRLDWATALFTTLVAIASGVVFGLAPAWRASRASASLVASGSLTGRGPADVPRLRLGRTLLVAQIGLSLALVFTAALFVQSLRRLHHVDTGFDARNLLLFTVNPILNGYDEARVLGYWREGVRRLRGVQGVLNATVTTHALIANSSSSSSFFYSAPDGSQQKVPLVYRLSVADDFFETMRIPLRFGRRIDARDSSRGVRAAVINETLARMAFPGVSPLGQRFQLSSRPNVPVYDVVGVVADARYATLRREVPAIAYISLAENPSPGPMTFYVRTAEEPGRIAHAIEDLMPGVDTSVPIYGFRTQEEQVERYLAQDRFFAGLGTELGSAALLLACIGIYGLLSYSLARRTPELGIRLALGAAPADVIRLVFRESMIVAGTGILVGIPAAVAVARTARSTLFEVAVVSPVILALAVGILVAVAAFAVYLPARRAARLDPLTALRV
jgi:predicted permease